jgi:hypothetical protein
MFSTDDALQQAHIATLEYVGQRYTVTCRVSFDGIEHVGRLWFAPEDSPEMALPDRAAIPGRSREEVLALARRLTIHEIGQRHRRAMAEKRRYMKLRRVTDDILTKIRYLNQISISVRDGLLDEEGAAQEIELTEAQLHECVDRLRETAGVED